MPLSSAKSGLESGIKIAYNNAKDAASQDGANPDTIANALGKGIGNAIHLYMLQAQVSTIDMIPPESTTPPPMGTLAPMPANGKGNLV